MYARIYMYMWKDSMYVCMYEPLNETLTAQYKSLIYTKSVISLQLYSNVNTCPPMYRICTNNNHDNK